MTKAEGSPVEVTGAWLLSVLDGGGWREAEAIEAERAAAGVSARALTTARGRLVRDGRVEKRKAGRGAWSYRMVERVPPPEPAPAPEAADPAPDPEPAARLLRGSGAIRPDGPGAGGHAGAGSGATPRAGGGGPGDPGGGLRVHARRGVPGAFAGEARRGCVGSG